MKSLGEHKKEFLKQASEFDTGKKEEDFHAYLRHHNLEHHLSETQIADRNRDSNYLNGVGLTLGIGIPLTLGAMFGAQKLTSNIIGHNGFRHLVGDNRLPRSEVLFMNYNDDSLSGTNTRPMPRADANIGQDIPTHSDAVINAVERSRELLGDRHPFSKSRFSVEHDFNPERFSRNEQGTYL